MTAVRELEPATTPVSEVPFIVTAAPLKLLPLTVIVVAPVLMGTEDGVTE
jgi:hypothetical protein